MTRPRAARHVGLRVSERILDAIREEVMQDWLAAELQFQLRHARPGGVGLVAPAEDGSGELRMRPEPRGPACFPLES